jgi:hypothetical protein
MEQVNTNITSTTIRKIVSDETHESLDRDDLDTLFQRVRLSITDNPMEVEIIATKLNAVYLRKTCRVLRSTSCELKDFSSLANNMARTSKLITKFDQASMSVRWSVLQDLLAEAVREMLAQEQAPSAVGKGRIAWEFVAKQVLQHSKQGIGWSTLANSIRLVEGCPSSKGGVSLLITAMRAAGWVSAIARGREKTLFPGPKIHESIAWKDTYALRNESNSLININEPVKPIIYPPSVGDKVIELIKNATCTNQSKIIEYFYLAGENHRKLKESEVDHKLDFRKTLLKHLNYGLIDAARSNFKYIEEYFNLRGSNLPRICIKGNWSNEHDQKVIVDVIRNINSDYQPSPSTVESNTGFQKVCSSGHWELINNIPLDAWRGAYKNPRLNIEKLRKVLFEQTLTSDSIVNRDVWRSCWNDSDQSESKHFYQSTLIIPITLRNSELTDEFRKSIIERTDGEKEKTIDRIILGYLCFDHEDANYFNSHFDVHMGYIFADLMSIYMFIRSNYTSISNTFKALKRDEIKAEETLQYTLKNMRKTVKTEVVSNAGDLEQYLVTVDPAIFQGVNQY